MTHLALSQALILRQRISLSSLPQLQSSLSRSNHPSQHLWLLRHHQKVSKRVCNKQQQQQLQQRLQNRS